MVLGSLILRNMYVIQAQTTTQHGPRSAGDDMKVVSIVLQTWHRIAARIMHTCWHGYDGKDKEEGRRDQSLLCVDDSGLQTLE